jgi:Arc/MetJ-type ribon-helix-helix transcriptional regulator
MASLFVLQTRHKRLTVHPMKTLTIRLPDSLLRDVEAESEARRMSKSDVVRERLLQSATRTRPAGSTWDRIKDVLEQSWNAKVPPKPRRFHSPHKQKLAIIIRAKKLHR